MNILSDEQAASRQLLLPRGGVLDGLSEESIAELQGAGAFVEYNQQAITPAGEMNDYVACIVAGRVKISRVTEDYSRAPVARLGAGEWFGEANLFVRVPSPAEVYADGEVVLWTMPADILRNLFFDGSQGVQLLYSFAVLMAQRMTARSGASGPKS